MMKTSKAFLLACGLVLACTSAARAQAPDEPARAFVSIGGGYLFASQTSTDGGTFALYDETGSFSGDRKTGNSPFFEFGGGMHITGKISGGVAVSYFSKGNDTSFTALVPHPLFAGQLRTVALNIDDLGHSETAVHLQAIYQVYTSGRIDASVFGGPSIIRVSEDIVGQLTATESGSPYTAVALDATFESVSKTALGINVGADANYRIQGPISAGVVLRYAYASAKMPSGSSTRKVTLGGPQVGVALKYRF